MKNVGRTTLIISIIICLLTAAPAFGRILVIHSYHEQYDWVQGINEGLRSHLKSDAAYRIVYMDTKRHPDAAWKKTSARNAKNIIAEYRPKVIIAVDDNAQRYVAREFVGNSPVQIVFCGVNDDPETYGYPAGNVTGILERAYPHQVFRMLKMIMPQVENVAWVSDDSPTALGVLPRVRQKAESNQLPLKIVDYTMPSTFERWKKTIASHEKNPDIHAFLIPVYHTVKAQIDGESMRPSTVMRWTVANTSKPVVGFWPFSTDDGALCAVAVDPYEHGKVAALMANQILAGKRASDIPVVTNQDGYVIVNLKSANRLKAEVPFEVIQSADRTIE